VRPEGQYRCAAASECPSGWFCVDGRCYSEPGDGSDGGFDAGSRADGGRDEDGGPIDPDDAGADAGAPVPREIVPFAMASAGADSQTSAELGGAVDLLDGQLVAGAPGALSSQGRVHLFGVTGTGVTPASSFTVLVTAGSPELGFSVAAGSGFVYSGRPGSNELVAYDLADESTLSAAPGHRFFGSALARNGATELLVGAYLADVMTTTEAGRAFRYALDLDEIAELGRVDLPMSGDVFGSSIATDGSCVAIGAPSRGPA